jgi:NADH dehydrogenase (ubiquinone) 1 alpha subcomplex subunit 6
MRFEANRNVTDLRAIDVLLLKSRQEYQETLNLWKQTDHIYGILLKPKERPSRTFLQKFYEGALYCSFRAVIRFSYHGVGRDEEAIVPAASGV